MKPVLLGSDKAVLRREDKTRAKRVQKNQYTTDLETVGFAGCIRAVFPNLVYFVQKNKIPTPIKPVNGVAEAGRNLLEYSISLCNGTSA